MTKDRWENTVWDTDVYLDELDGKEPMTNEEWLKQANTEQLAEWMALRLNPGILLALRMKYHCTDINAVREWLKEKHD